MEQKKQKYKVIAITGMSHVGKHNVLAGIASETNLKHLHILMRLTTFPKANYNHFEELQISLETLKRTPPQNWLISNTSNGWHYGILREDLRPNLVNILVARPDEINELALMPDIELKTFQITSEGLFLLRVITAFEMEKDNPRTGVELAQDFLDNSRLIDSCSQYIDRVFPNDLSTDEEYAIKEIIKTVEELYDRI